MTDRYTSLMALVVDEPVDDVGAVVASARAAGDIDRASAVQGQAVEAQEVHWGGRMQRAVVRRTEDTDGAPLLRSETYIGAEGVKQGLARQAQLLQALARQLGHQVEGVRDLSGRAERDLAWLARVAIGAAETSDAIQVATDGVGTHWVHTHGAARFDVPDLELYGLAKASLDQATAALRAVHEQLLAGGLKAPLALPSGEAVYLVPVTEAWQHLSLDWPGIGRAGEDRGPGLDGPRATLSVLHKPRFGRYRKDFKGVIRAL